MKIEQAKEEFLKQKGFKADTIVFNINIKNCQSIISGLYVLKSPYVEKCNYLLMSIERMDFMIGKIEL